MWVRHFVAHFGVGATSLAAFVKLYLGKSPVGGKGGAPFCYQKSRDLKANIDCFLLFF